MSLEELNKKIEKEYQEYQEYLSNLTSAERATHLKEIEGFDNSMNKFWNEKYPKMNLEEKKKYWLASTHKGMRTQGEAFGMSIQNFLKNGMILPKSTSQILMKYFIM